MARRIVPSVAAVLALLVALACGGEDGGDEFNAGAADQYTLTSITTYTDGDVAERSTEPGSEGEFVLDGTLVFHLVRLESGEFIALSARDPESDCWVPWQPEFEFDGRAGWFVDPCGGSTYNEEGVRVSGPAPRDLARHPVEVRDGEVFVNLDEDVVIPGVVRVQPAGPDATATETPATPTAGVATATPTSPATPTPTPTATATPAATATPTEVVTPPVVGEGSPFDGDDFIAALAAEGIDVEAARAGDGCSGAGVRPVLYGPEGGPAEPAFTLWVYPSPAALEADWELPSSGPPVSNLDDCPPIAGTSLFWNANLLLDFGERSAWAGQEALRESIRDAFLGLDQ